MGSVCCWFVIRRFGKVVEGAGLIYKSKTGRDFVLRMERLRIMVLVLLLNKGKPFWDKTNLCCFISFGSVYFGVSAEGFPLIFFYSY